MARRRYKRKTARHLKNDGGFLLFESAFWHLLNFITGVLLWLPKQLWRLVAPSLYPMCGKWLGRPLKSKRGEWVRDSVEAQIADFLLKKNINYHYDKRKFVWWVFASVRPAFFLPQHKVAVFIYRDLSRGVHSSRVEASRRRAWQTDRMRAMGIKVIDLTRANFNNPIGALEKAFTDHK